MKPCKKCGSTQRYDPPAGRKIGKCKSCEKIYQRNHSETIRKKSEKWRKLHPDKASAASRKWDLCNPEKVKENKRRWNAANPEKVRDSDRNKRAQRRSVNGNLSKGINARLFKLQQGKCACCKADLSKISIHRDHVMPLALGGENIDSNVQLLCQPCNQSKHAKHPVEFMQSKGFLL